MGNAARIVTVVFGALFVGIGVVIPFVAEGGAGPWIAALAVGGLGVDAIVAALRGRRPLIVRIGPLP